jgi:Lipoprotein amino terminal region
LLSGASTETDKLRVLKAMGNMGAKEFITPLKAVIEDRSLSKYLRVEAVIALRKLAKPYDKLVTTRSLADRFLRRNHKKSSNFFA